MIRCCRVAILSYGTGLGRYFLCNMQRSCDRNHHLEFERVSCYSWEQPKTSPITYWHDYKPTTNSNTTPHPMQQPHPLILCLCLPFQRNVSPSLALASHLLCIISVFGTSAVSYLHSCHRFIEPGQERKMKIQCLSGNNFDSCLYQ